MRADYFDYEDLLQVVPKMLIQLNFFEFAVIYLALGTPVGVYHLVTHWGGPLISTLPLAVLSVCVWPAAALIYLYGPAPRPHTGYRLLTTSSCFHALVREAGKVLTADELFRFREIMTRYIGVCDALNRPIGTSAADGVQEILGQKASATAKACWIRRNRAKLYRQQDDSRINFLAQVDCAACRNPAILKLGSDLALSLGDHIGSDHLTISRAPQSGNIHVSSDRISIAA